MSHVLLKLMVYDRYMISSNCTCMCVYIQWSDRKYWVLSVQTTMVLFLSTDVDSKISYYNGKMTFSIINISYRHIYKEKTHVVRTSSSRKYVSSLEKRVLFHLVAENHQKKERNEEWKEILQWLKISPFYSTNFKKMSLMEYNTLCASVEKTMHI